MRQLAAPASLRRWAGFSLFEMAVAAIIMALLAGALLQRLRDYREQAEQASVERMVGVLRTALVIKTAQLRARDAQQEIAALAGQNPMDWLTEKPSNYLGDYFSPDVNALSKGNWFFDRKTKVLVYLLNREKKFPQSTVKTISFRVEFIRLPSNPAKQNGAPETKSVSLIQVHE